MIAFLSIMDEDEDREFLIGIHERYFACIKKRLTETIPPEDIEDCLQDCFVRLVANVHQLQKLQQAQITVYIRQTIRSVIVDYKRKKKLLITNYDIGTISDQKQLSSVEREMDDRETYDLFCRGFHKLPETDQIILRGLYQYDMSRSELAKKLGIKPASIRTYISRAKKHALQLMRGEFDEK